VDNKIKELIKILKNFDLDSVKKIEEEFDEQYKALKFLYSNLKNKKSFPLLVILNALVSYQLNTKGENYWWEFANYFSNRYKFEIIEDEIQVMKEFLNNSKGNKRFLSIKIKRLEKLRYYLDKIRNSYLFFYENMIELQKLLSKALGQNKNSKTIVFAVKMFGYSMRIYSGKFVPYPFEIKIPLDSRIKRITKKFTDEDPKKFWFKLSKEVNIPSLHLDALLWTLYGSGFENLKELLPNFYYSLEELYFLIK
jgi:DNA-(apurinic or apyrimidinic site) lyase